jgi:MFS transporter, MHS family, proline/betaine transporter
MRIGEVEEQADPGGLRATRSAGLFGNAVEWYDFAVLGASATLVSAALTPSGGLTTVFSILAISLLVRPVGALLGAAWADRAGRRPPMIVTVSAMSLATAAIALLPPWATAGTVVVVLLLLLRVVQGLATGAELVVSVVYLVEHAPPDRRGTWGGLHMATIAAGFLGGTLAVAVVSVVLSEQSLASWGWRIPFLVALPLGYAALRLRLRVAETPDFRAMASRERGMVTGSRHPVGQHDGARPESAEVLRRPRTALLHHSARLISGFLLAAGLMSSFALWFIFLPAHLADRAVHPLPVALGCAVAGLLAMALSAVLSGNASDDWGRRPVIAAGIVVVALAWLLAFPRVIDGSVTALLVGSLIAGAGLGGFVLQSALAEAFPTPVRATGLAVTLGLASAVVGGTSPLVADILANRSPALVSAYALAWLAAASVGLIALRATPQPVSSTGRPGAR